MYKIEKKIKYKVPYYIVGDKVLTVNYESKYITHRTCLWR